MLLWWNWLVCSECFFWMPTPSNFSAIEIVHSDSSTTVYCCLSMSTIASYSVHAFTALCPSRLEYHNSYSCTAKTNNNNTIIESLPNRKKTALGFVSNTKEQNMWWVTLIRRLHMNIAWCTMLETRRLWTIQIYIYKILTDYEDSIAVVK